MTILVVDDQPNGARIASYAIRAEGHTCVVAHTLAEAEAALTKMTFDGLFLDLNLRGENGLDLIDRMQASGSQVPVVLFSAFSDDEVSAEAMRRGAFGWMIKPYTLVELRAMLARLSSRQPPPAVAV